MMRRLVSSLALAGALALSAGPALAADPAGDWRGVLQAHNGRTDLGLEIRAAPGGYRATYEDMTHDARGLPMMAVRDSAPAFRIDSLYGALSISWDGAAGHWRGVWRDRAGAYAMSFQRGAIPPAPPVPKGLKVTIAVLGGLMLLEAAGIARLLQVRRRWRLRRAAA